MDNNNENENKNEKQKIYKTPSYQRRAYKNYILRMKDNEDFMLRRKQQQRKYYENNREKIIQKVKERKENNKHDEEKINCECGSIVKKYNIKKHNLCKKHIKHTNI